MDEIEKLKSENEELKKVNENKSDLISVTAHQLRTSLSALKWTLKMFLDKDLGDINKEQEEYLGKAIESNQRAISLVNYLLTFNHTDNISMAAHINDVNLIILLKKVISIFQGELKNKKIELIFNKPESDIPNINCDEEMIMDVLQNLIENSIKYSNNNSVINTSLKYISSNNVVIISVHDNGIGIDKDDQMKIFNKFFRAPNAIDKESVGSGLGLFTAKSIVEKLGGKIWFESSKESGTTFFVSLPVS